MEFRIQNSRSNSLVGRRDNRWSSVITAMKVSLGVEEGCGNITSWSPCRHSNGVDFTSGMWPRANLTWRYDHPLKLHHLPPQLTLGLIMPFIHNPTAVSRSLVHFRSLPRVTQRLASRRLLSTPSESTTPVSVQYSAGTGIYSLNLRHSNHLHRANLDGGASFKPLAA